ncbi:MAG: phosphatidylserine/phosphatidylglycerophosphate/cardiolipin synthase family protein [Peptococcaceae bacterium]|nr:phosphatidylserine/phosphatidylglycerophosphate/cardiolipin synthase family protein [Peptococcaceae bacterium]
MKATAIPFTQHLNRIFWILAISGILLSAACTTGCAKPVFTQETALSPLGADAVLVDGAVHEQALQLIRSAEHSLYIEQMTLNDPLILSEIIAKAKTGLEVRILLDQWQRENQNTVSQLKSNNISVQYYPTEKGQFHRQKFLISDNTTVLFVSAPWTEDHAKFSSLAFMSSGDTAQKAVDLFARDWKYTTTLDLDIKTPLDQSTLPPDKITLTSTAGIKNLILTHIETAQDSIQIETQQLSGDNDIITALVAAQQRGCQVRLLLDPSCQEATPQTLAIFADAGIEFRFFKAQDKILNRNFAVFDSQFLVYTSSAWIYSTFVINHEGALAIPSPSVAQKCAGIFQTDWESVTP